MTMTRLLELRNVTDSPRVVCTTLGNLRSISVLRSLSKDIEDRPEACPAHKLMTFEDSAEAERYFTEAEIPSSAVVYLQDSPKVKVCSFKHSSQGSIGLHSCADWGVQVGSDLREDYVLKVAQQTRAIYGAKFMEKIDVGIFPWGPPPKPRAAALEHEHKRRAARRLRRANRSSFLDVDCFALGQKAW